jgi:predicted dehydrogenase
VRRVAEALDDSAVIVSVGYMFRYSLAVERMRELLQQTPGGARAVAARYGCAYSEIRKPFWWDVRRSGGPVVEQATHFLDLARHLAGEADLGSVRAVAIPETSPCAQLSDAPPMPDGRTPREAVPAPFRGPVATAAVWRFTSGAVASLTHGALLHGRKYDCELEVWGDGLRLLLEDPYGSCRLSIRRPGGEETTVETFSDDDPYLTEDAAFVEAVRTGEASAIRSGYADALKTHELAWAIRSASQPPAGQAEA